MRFVKENTQMKIAKRVFIGILALAILVSSLSLATSAELALDNYDDILSYYDPALTTIYVDEGFEEKEAGIYDGIISTTDDDTATYAKIVADGGKYLSVVLGNIVNTRAQGNMLVYNEVEAGLRSFIYDYSFNVVTSYMASCTADDCSFRSTYKTEAEAPAVCPDCEAETVVSVVGPEVKLLISKETLKGEDVEKVSTKCYELVSVDSASGAVSYLDGDYTKKIDGFTVDSGKWYDVHVSYGDATYTLTVSERGNSDNKASVTALTPAAKVKSFVVGTLRSLDCGDNVISYDDFYLQAGPEYRNITVEERQEITERAIDDLLALYSNEIVTVEDKLGIVGVYEALVNEYGYVADDEEAIKDVETFKDVALALYESFVSECIAAYEAEEYYKGKEKLLADKDYAAYAAKVELYDAESEVLAAYNAKKEELAEAKVNSEAFLAYMKSAVGNGVNYNDYNAVKAVVDGAKDFKYDATYPGVDDYDIQYNVLCSTLTVITNNSTKFIESVAKAKDTENTVAERVVAYKDAKAFKNKANVTFSGVSEALIDYETVDAELSPVITLCERFLNNMSNAANTLDVKASEQYLASAAVDLEFILADETGLYAQFAGVSENVTLYSELVESNAAKRAAAQAYIDAVNAIEGKTGAELEAAIAAANALKASGNVSGVDGVNDANIKLNDAESKIDNAERYAEKFFYYVDAIDAAKNMPERYAAIKAAKAAEAQTDDSVKGVAEAKAKLAGIISTFNADANTVNSTFATVCDSANEIVTFGTMLEDLLLKVLSFIQGLFS